MLQASFSEAAPKIGMRIAIKTEGGQNVAEDGARGGSVRVLVRYLVQEPTENRIGHSNGRKCSTVVQYSVTVSCR